MTSRATDAAITGSAEDFLVACERAAERGWARIHRGAFWRDLEAEGLDRDTYVDLMTQIYHYTRHNAQNQALAAVRVGSERLQLLKYCLHHAFEEAGHDLMVLHDLETIGVDRRDVVSARPSPETEAFVAWLYRTATERDATARLGYSFWAESCYGAIAPLIAAMRRDLGLADRQMSFFVAHSTIDRDHFDEVREVVAACCDTPERRRGLLDVLETSLALTGSILEGVQRGRLERRAR